MGYLRTILGYLRTEKARRDLIDWLRAVMIIGAMMAMVRIIVDMLRSLLSS
jgi:hypothetical protein